MVMYQLDMRPSLAAIFTRVYSQIRSNTNTTPNYRVPITAKTHESTCTRGCVSNSESNKRLWIIAQKAGKQTTGYFAGYTVKRQPVGKYELQQSAQCLNVLQAQIRDDKPLRQLPE